MLELSGIHDRCQEIRTKTNIRNGLPLHMRTAAQVLSLQHTSKPVIAKNNDKDKT